MIKSAEVIEATGEEGEVQHILVEFDDGSCVWLNEKELQNAAALAEKGCLNE